MDREICRVRDSRKKHVKVAVKECQSFLHCHFSMIPVFRKKFLKGW